MRKVALVYDRVNKWGGAERVLLALNEMFPSATLYTSVYSKKAATWASTFPKIVPTFLQKIPYAQNNHEKLALCMPMAFESIDLSKYDLVISVTSEAAKGVITSPGALHICYCLTPTRYLWSGYDEYFDTSLIKTVSKPAVSYLRHWDKIAAHRPDVMIAISGEVQQRIKKYYGRNSTIIYPPVSGPLAKKGRQGQSIDYYLLVSRLVKYKKVDIAVQAFNQLNMPLMIVGAGTEEMRLREMANKNITFATDVRDSQLSQYYASSKALIMPQFEDFGLVSVEAQMNGTPVIAYGKGGALDTVINNETGLLFEHQTVSSLINAVRKFENMKFDSNAMRKNAARFSKEKFKAEFMDIIVKNL